MIHDEDLQVMAEKLYNNIMHNITLMGVSEGVDEDKILILLIDLLKKHYKCY